MRVSLQFFKVPVKPFGFDKEIRIWEEAINDTYTVERIEGSNKVVPGILDSTHMSGRDVSGRTDQCEVLRCYRLVHRNLKS